MVFNRQSELIPKALIAEKKEVVEDESDEDVGDEEEAKGGLDLLIGLKEKSKFGAKDYEMPTFTADSIDDEKFKLARILRLEEEAMIDRLANFKAEDIPLKLDYHVRLTDNDILKFVRTQNLEEVPIDLLSMLSDRLKERRQRIHK